MSTLAINGGEKIFGNEFKLADYPSVYLETAVLLSDIYLKSRKWSYFGPYEQQFAESFAKYHDSSYGGFMANGTVTLECALGALGVGPGDEVIVPGITWQATASAVCDVNAVPVLVDVDAETLCIDPTKIEENITSRTRAIIPVHLYHRMADMDKILPIAKKHNLVVIEDSAHSHGSQWDRKGAGTLGDFGSFSFQSSKLLNAGEGGDRKSVV